MMKNSINWFLVIIIITSLLISCKDSEKLKQVDSKKDKSSEIKNSESIQKKVNYINEKGTKYVAAKRTYFYNEPDVSTKTDKFIIKGQEFNYNKRYDEFVFGAFTNDRGKTTSGWIKLNDLSDEFVMTEESKQESIERYQKLKKEYEEKNESHSSYKECTQESAQIFANEYVNRIYPGSGKPIYHWGKLSDCSFGFNYAVYVDVYDSYKALTIIVELNQGRWVVLSTEFN